jgi:hypothetical protein
MTRLLILCVLFISFSAFSDPTISIKSNSIVDAGTTQDITREKVINVSKAQRDINSKIAEEVKSKSVSKSSISKYSTGIEYSLGAVVLPYIKAIENGELDNMGSESIGYIRRCALNSHKLPTVIGPMFGYGGEILYSRVGGLGGQGGAIQTQEAIQNMTASMPSFMSISKDAERNKKYIASKYGVRPETPQETLVCYFYYGILYEQIARNIFSQSILGEESQASTVLYVDSLQITVARAIARAVKDDNLLNRAKNMAEQNSGSTCTVPSLQALNKGQLDFSCGSFSFNYQSREAVNGNTIIWSKDTFMGGSITLSEVSAFEIAKANEIASVYRNTAEEIQANERATGLNKSTSLVQVRDTKVSTGGDASISN